QGRIDLNENITNYLPDGFMAPLTYDEPVTMIHLMNHTAGFEENIFDLGYGSKDQVTSLKQGLQIAKPKQIYKPGDVVAYSNYSTSLAAYIVQRVSGQTFDDYVSEHILAKLGMHHTSPNLATEKDKTFFQNK